MNNTTKVLMLGNAAIARGAFEAGAKVASAYPGTPSTEITEYISQYKEIYSEWAPNEKVAMETVIGSSIAGARSICAMKHVGLNVAADPLFTASYTGVNAGLVICVADDQGMHSSQNEQDSRHYANASKTLMLEPADSNECKEFVKKAFAMSEEYDTPVIIRLSTRISHSQGLVEINEPEDVALKPYEKNPGKYVMMPAMARARHIIVEDRINKLKELAETSPLNHVEYNSKKIGVIAGGIAYQYAKEALGENASYLKLGIVYPLPEKLLKDFAASVDECYVIEELDPVIENHCKAIGINVIGKEKFSLLGEYSAEMISNIILNKKSEFVTRDEQIPGRPPVMCAGCPHRAVFNVLNRLKVVVSGDIGCYTLAALSPLNALDACVCMGASVSMAHGMDKARQGEMSKKTVAVIGDSTFIHSGITSLIDIVYNKGNSTVIILDNSITGMTGHQENPTTGKTIKGEPTTQINLKLLCEAVGVKRVTVIDPFNTDDFTALVKQELAAEEVSVIIAQRPCALLKSAAYTGKCSINIEKCKKCNICLKTGCPAIIKVNDNLTIEPTLCVGCTHCQRVCKFGAIDKEDGQNG